MASIDVRNVLEKQFSGTFEDEGVLEYLVSVVEGMTLEEKRSSTVLFEVISPFLIDAGISADETAAEATCKSISVCFGGSGYKSSISGSIVSDVEDAPQLLSAPIKIIDQSGLKPVKQTYGGAVFADATCDIAMTGQSLASNAVLESSAIPTTQKQLRKQRKENEALNKILRAEAQQRAEAAAEMMAARMAAIRASRASGRQAFTGVSLERLCLPHPSGTGELLSDATLTLAPGRRYGLIGRNGAGKTTLMRCLANYKVDGLSHLRILLVDQHVEGDDDNAMQWLLRADVERTALLEDESRLTMYLHYDPSSTECGSVPPLPDDLKGVNIELALTECYERMEAIGVSTAEMRAQKILIGLGFDQSMMLRPTTGLSGGWAMRAALAAALFVKPNLLLLDEPTNHLDLHALVWLENYLQTDFSGMVIVVSHDEKFLDAVCTDVLELRSTLAGQSKSSLEHFSGDYATFENTIKERKVAQARIREVYEKEKEKLKEFIAREGKKYDNPAHQAQRKMKQKQLQALVEVEEVEEESELTLSIPSPYGVFDQSEKLLSVANVSFAWPDQQPLFQGVDFVVTTRARVAILGKNGCGKTSLLNILMGEEPPSSGNVNKHVGCRITMLQQHHYKGEQLDPNLCALDHVKRLPQDESTAVGLHDPGTRQEETSQRGFLANFGIRGNRALIPVKYLSGGQRMRVALAMALFKRPDLLILDEPSNHLDHDTLRALCDALSDFKGAIIAVSHDESFVNRVIASAVTGDKRAVSAGLAAKGELWVMSKQRLTRFDGSFSEYKKMIRKKVMEGLDHNSL